MDIDNIYATLDGSQAVMDYHKRHKVDSLCILTFSPETARKRIALLKRHLVDKTVVEIGAGVGYAALEIAKYAKQVYAIEADPAWSWQFVKYLYKHKPANLTWIFGSAQSCIGKISGDIVIIFTRSDLIGLRKLGKKFAPKVILGYQDLIDKGETVTGSG